MTAIRDSVSSAIRQLEELSKKKVVIQEDPNLQTLATVRTARGSVPFHLITYSPNSKGVNYLILFQIGFTLRLFSCSKESRWEVASNSEKKAKAQTIFANSGIPEVLAGSLIDNLITQLRSVPIGFRVDDWIRREFPELIEEQEASANQQLLQSEQCLSPEIRDKFPRFIIDVNSTMNAAFAGYWSDHLKESRLTLPYEALGYASKAAKLLSLAATIEDSPSKDRELIEAWGDNLNMSDFFHFDLHR